MKIGIGLSQHDDQAQTLVADTIAPVYSSGEVGDVADTIVVVKFSEYINSPSLGYDAGVTIKVATISQTISAATRQADESVVHYTIPAVSNGQAVTFEYAAISGDIEDQRASNALGNVSEQSVTNNVA
jgi:hypothetical protein